MRSPVSSVLALPLALHPWTHVLLIYACYSLTLGVTLATVFQLAHCVDRCTRIRGGLDDRENRHAVGLAGG